jgi:hypothetical protein
MQLYSATRGQDEVGRVGPYRGKNRWTAMRIFAYAFIKTQLTGMFKFRVTQIELRFVLRHVVHAI